MAGRGAGRRKGTGRLTTEQMFSIVVGDLYERGSPRSEAPFVLPVAFDPRERGGLSLSILAREHRLECTFTRTVPANPSADKTAEQLVQVTLFPCNFGGVTPKFHCPECGQLARELYFDPGRFRLLCRRCAGLRYPSQSRSRHERQAARAQAARERLGAGTSLGGPFPPKPKGMHWATYDRLLVEAELAEQAYLAERELQLERARRSLQRRASRPGQSGREGRAAPASPTGRPPASEAEELEAALLESLEEWRRPASSGE
jgi:hypothetical protein